MNNMINRIDTNEAGYITISHPQIVDFFKEKPQNEIHDIILTFIEFAKKFSPISSMVKTDKNGKDAVVVVDKDAVVVAATAVDEPVVPPEITRGEKTTEFIKINKYVLHEINKEYQGFAQNKDALIGVLKENEKQAFQLLNEMKMPYLEKYIYETCDTEISTKLQVVNQFKCELCNYYICNTKKALSAHQRGCKRYCEKRPQGAL
jgi:hypothetical protein